MIYPKLMFKKFEAKLNSFANPLLENLQPCKIKDILIGIAMSLVTLVALVCFCTKACINGDTAVYAQQMQNLDFTRRSVHIGYYLLGAGFIRIFPGSDDYILNIVNCFFGALTVMLLYLITLKICHKRIVAILSGLFLLTHYLFIENSVYAEVYIPQVCFILLAILCWLSDKPVFAGLSFAMACLMTPTAIFALPMFFIIRPRLKPLALFSVALVCLCTALIVPVWKNYFFGGRGLFTVMNQQVDWFYILRREGNEFFYSSFLCIPFIVLGLLAIFAQKKLRPFGIALLSLWIISLRFGEKNLSDWAVQFPTYTLLCMVGAFGFHLLLRISKEKWQSLILPAVILAALTITVILIKTTKTPAKIAPLLPTPLVITVVIGTVLSILSAILFKTYKTHAKIIVIATAAVIIAVNGSIAFAKIHAFNKYHNSYRDTMIEIGKTNEPYYVFIGHWSQYILFEHYVFQKSYTDQCTKINIKALAGSSGSQKHDKARKQLSEAIKARKKIWLLGNYYGLFKPLQQSGYKINRFRQVYIATPQ